MHITLQLKIYYNLQRLVAMFETMLLNAHASFHVINFHYYQTNVPVYARVKCVHMARVTRQQLRAHARLA